MIIVYKHKYRIANTHKFVRQGWLFYENDRGIVIWWFRGKKWKLEIKRQLFSFFFFYFSPKNSLFSLEIVCFPNSGKKLLKKEFAVNLLKINTYPRVPTGQILLVYTYTYILIIQLLLVINNIWIYRVGYGTGWPSKIWQRSP